MQLIKADWIREATAYKRGKKPYVYAVFKYG